jgi:hypothetical protein
MLDVLGQNQSWPPVGLRVLPPRRGVRIEQLLPVAVLIEADVLPVVILSVHESGRRELTDIGETVLGERLLPGRGEDGEEDGGEESDDGDDDEEFNERELFRARP